MGTAAQQGWVRRRATGWQACWRENGKQRTAPEMFATRGEARDWLARRLEPVGMTGVSRDMTFAAFVERYLEIHSANVEPATIRTLRERLGAGSPSSAARPYATVIDAFGDLPLCVLESRRFELAAWQATLPAGYRYAIVRAVRQVLNAAVRWKLLSDNPTVGLGANPKPRAPEVAFFGSLNEVDRLAAALPSEHASIGILAVETGLRPSEWAALQRDDVDLERGLLRVRHALVDGQMRPFGKTTRSKRDVPLTARALHALDTAPVRVHTTFLFSSPLGRPIDLDNWRHRVWRPAVAAAGLDTRLTPYSMRHTYASFALDAGITIFELARLMGTSVRVIDDTYGHLVRDSFDRVRGALEERARRDLST